MSSVPCLYCQNVMGQVVVGRERYMARHRSQRAVQRVGEGRLEVETLEWWLCPVCHVSWELFPAARVEIEVAASMAVR